MTNINDNLREWVKVSELSAGMQIAVPTNEAVQKHWPSQRRNFPTRPLADGPQGTAYNSGQDREGDVMWDEIAEIRKVGEERVWDIEVEGTHNFVAGHLMRPARPQAPEAQADGGQAAEVANAEVEQSPEWVALTPEEEKDALEHESIKTLKQNNVWFGAIYAHNTYISGNVGIGITAPTAMLHASTTDESTIGVKITLSGAAPTANAFEIQSQAGAFFSGFTAAGGLLMNIASTTAINVQDGSGTSVFSVDTTNYQVNIKAGTAASSSDVLILKNANNDVKFKVQDSGQIFSDYGTTVTQSADLAEWTRVLGPVEEYEAGDLVAISPPTSSTAPLYATKTTFAYQPTLYGVVTDRGAFSGGLSHASGDDLKTLSPEQFAKKYNARKIGLVGYVQAKVSTVNGAIKHGDPLSASDIPGAAMKATKSGKIIGYAREDFGPAEGGNSVGKIEIYVNSQWAEPEGLSAADTAGTLSNVYAMIGDASQFSTGKVVAFRQTSEQGGMGVGLATGAAHEMIAGVVDANQKGLEGKREVRIVSAGIAYVQAITDHGMTPLAIGDLVASAGVPGLAAKASGRGMILGQALSALSAGEGLALVKVNPSHAAAGNYATADEVSALRQSVAELSVGIGVAASSTIAEIPNPESQIPNTGADVTIVEAPTAFENIAIGQNAAVGGRLDVAGDATVGQLLTVAGRVQAREIVLGGQADAPIGLSNRSSFDLSFDRAQDDIAQDDSAEGLLVEGFTQFGIGSLPAQAGLPAQATSTVLLTPTSIENPQSGDVFVTGRLEVSGMAYFAGGISVPQGDIAEKMSVLEGVVGMGNEIRNPKSEILNVMRKPEPGDVVVIDGTGTAKVRLSWRAEANDIAGVISTDPASILKRGESGEPVAVAGTVPVKVSGEGGAIKRGDLLATASLLGHAKKATFADAGTLGVAMAEEDFATASTSVITVLLSIKNSTTEQHGNNTLNDTEIAGVTEALGEAQDPLPVMEADEEGALTVAAAVTTYGGNLEVRGAVAVGGALAVRSAVVEETLVVKGDVEIGGSLKVAGSSVIKGNLELEGALVSTFWEWIDRTDLPSPEGFGRASKSDKSDILNMNGVTTTDMWIPGSEGAATTSAFILGIGDAVRIADENAVMKVTAGDKPFEPAIGLVVEIEEWVNEEGRLARNIKVATAGTIRGWEGLLTGARYYVASTGTEEYLRALWQDRSDKTDLPAQAGRSDRPLVALATSAPEAGGNAIQVMGVARSQTEFILMPSLDYRVVEDRSDLPAQAGRTDTTDSVIVPIVEPVVVPAPAVEEAPVQDDAQDIIELEGEDMTAPVVDTSDLPAQADRSDKMDSVTTPLESAPAIVEEMSAAAEAAPVE